MDYIIRPYSTEDREAVRRISCETVFQDISREKIFNDDEIIADALTSYFTDYEPESCLVAESGKRIVGYCIGARDLRAVQAYSIQVFLRVFEKAVRKKILFSAINRRFLFSLLKSYLFREFSVPDFSREFPATLHINLYWDFRNRGIGTALIEQYVRYLRGAGSPGVHINTSSGKAKDFFVRAGFRILFSGKRSFLRAYTGKIADFYVLGREL
jgi:GNAT superfamily N-acetyltransferase